MGTARRLFHTGLDGERWFLCYCPEAGCVYVAHEMPAPATGITVRVELHDLLRAYPDTPEQEALNRFIGALMCGPGTQPFADEDAVPNEQDTIVG